MTVNLSQTSKLHQSRGRPKHILTTRSEDRRFVPLDTASKGEEFPDAGCTHVFEPGIKSLTAVVANEVQETVSEVSCLRECAIHLTETIQLLLSLRAQRLGTSHHPPDDLPWGHIFEG